jgi:hypothetical protein
MYQKEKPVSENKTGPPVINSKGQTLASNEGKALSTSGRSDRETVFGSQTDGNWNGTQQSEKGTATMAYLPSKHPFSFVEGQLRFLGVARSRDSRIPRHLFRGRCVAGHFMRTSRHNGRYCLKGADDLAGDGMTRALCTRQYKKSRRKRGWTATKRQCRKKCD